jgi:hypothetical protein
MHMFPRMTTGEVLIPDLGGLGQNLLEEAKRWTAV